MNAKEPDTKWRKRARQALESYFHKQSAPRLILALLLTLTGAAGFLVSVALLHGGVQQMWLRYPIAALSGYGVFLLLLRGWVEFEKSHFNPRAGEIEKALEEGSFDNPSWANRHRGSSWPGWLDFPSNLDPGEGCIPVLLLGVLLALVGLLIFVILSASGLIAEVFLDAFIVTVLYRRLRVAAQEHWLGTAVRKTWLPALLTAALLSLGGWCLGTMAPAAHSIGPALDYLLQDRPQSSAPP